MANKFTSVVCEANIDSGLFSSDRLDTQSLASLITKAYDQLDKDGYDVVNVIPVSSKVETFGATPYTLTDTAIVIGRKKNTP